MEVNNEKIVRFDVYCRTCKDKELNEDEDPCNECLTSPVNVNSHKPINYKENK